MHATDLSQIVFAFIYGLFFGPFSNSIVYVIISLIVFELYVIISTRMAKPLWQFEFRVTMNAAGLIGWVLGRWLILDETGIEDLSGLPYRVFGKE